MIIGGRKALVTPKSLRLRGTQHKNETEPHRQEIIRAMEVGSVVQFVREPNNPEDENAIGVVFENEDGPKGRVGYLPRELSAILAPSVDEGMALSGLVMEIGKNLYGKLTVEIKIFEYADE